MTETVYIPTVTIGTYKGQDWLYYDGERKRVANFPERCLWYQGLAEQARIRQEHENAQRWYETREWLTEACPGRDWDKGTMPTGRNGKDE